MAKWTTSDIPLQSGRSVVITGTGGLGYETRLAARAGADVITAGRDPVKGATRFGAFATPCQTHSLRSSQIDLASLQSIRTPGTRLRRTRSSLDLLINNAAVMTPPNRMETSAGFELQFGTNHLDTMR